MILTRFSLLSDEFRFALEALRHRCSGIVSSATPRRASIFKQIYYNEVVFAQIIRNRYYN